MTDPSVIGVLLGFPSFVFLVLVVAVTLDYTRLGRFATWLIEEAGKW